MSTILKQTASKLISPIIQYGIDKLKDGVGLDTYACDLHNCLYNEDYFIIGYGQAEEFLDSQVFASVNLIKEYEQDNFGEVSTDLGDSEKVVNMLAYIIGAEALNGCETLRDNWDGRMDKYAIQALIVDLEDQL